jgi:non-specific protein-tyrosine kinase
MAAAGLKTILLDADLRRPTLHELFGLPKTPGLGDFLQSSDVDIKDIEFSTPIENVYVITSGASLHNPSDSLDSPRMTALLASLTTAADVVIIDSPPMLAVADAVELATHVDGVILVLDAGQTGRAIARKSVAALRFTGARILGAVLNRVPNRPTYAYDAHQGSARVRPLSKVEGGTDS